MYKRNNISFLVLALAALLFYPGIVKSVHIHHNQHLTHESGHDAAISQPEEPCLVCDFEFVSVIISQSGQQTICLPQIEVANVSVPEIPSLRYPVYFSLRAPPVV